MTEFLQRVASKLGPNAAFDLARDARMKALETILVSRGMASEDEINFEVEHQLKLMAAQIEKMPISQK